MSIVTEMYEEGYRDGKKDALKEIMKDLEIIEASLNEARYFSKDVRQYLFEIEQRRELTDKEKELWDKTHNVHIHTNDSGLIIQKLMKE